MSSYQLRIASGIIFILLTASIALAEDVPKSDGCIVDSPRVHMTSGRKITQLDADYTNNPFDTLNRRFRAQYPVLPTAPGILEALWPRTRIPPRLENLAGVSVEFGVKVHIFFVEFPVNSVKKCVPVGWEHGETWYMGDSYTHNGNPRWFKKSYSTFTKVGDSTDTHRGRSDPINSRAWMAGTGRRDTTYPEAWIFIDGPGHLLVPIGQLRFGNYINVRLNIREGSTVGPIRGTSVLRLAQHLDGNGKFHSVLGGSGGGGTAQIGSLDPGLTNGRPSNDPATIPKVFSSHPHYVGQ